MRALFRSIEAQEDFLRAVDSVRASAAGRPIVFALYGAGVFEFLAIRSFLSSRYGDSWTLRVATRIPGLLIEPLGQLWLRALSKLGIRNEVTSRIRWMAEELKRGRPAILNFEPSDRRRPFETPKGERELRFLQEEVPHALIVPMVFVWRRRRRLDEGSGLSAQLRRPFRSALDLLLGDPYQPKGLRKLLLMLRQYSYSTMRLVEPLEILHAAPGPLRRKILMILHQEKRIVLGPQVPVPKLLAENIFRQPSFQSIVQRLAAESDKSERDLNKKSARYFREIAAQYTYFAIEIFGWTLSKIFKTIFDDISFDRNELERIRTLARQKPLVFVPCHKSYVDFLVLSYLLFREGLTPPHIAAGINLNFWPLGTLFKRSGAFFIRRSFRGNILYGEVLRRYIAELLNNHVNIEFFVEGTRSRNGKLAPPKYGVLKMILDSHLEGLLTEHVSFVPASIAYDRVTEERAHRRELEGGNKVQENVVNVVRSSSVLLKNYGKVYLRFGDPIDLDSWVQDQMPEALHDMDLRKLGVQKLAFALCHRINSVTPLTAVGLVSAVLLSLNRPRLPRSELESWMVQVHADVQATHCVLSPELKEDFHKAWRRALARLVDDKIIVREARAEGLFLYVPERSRISALYYKNSVIHGFLPLAIAGLSLRNPQDALELRNFLQFEFFFSDKESFLRSVTQVPGNMSLLLYARMLEDVLESIELGLRALEAMPGQSRSLKEWRNGVFRFAQERLQGRSVSRVESVNTQSMNAFVEMAQNRAWLVPSGDESYQPASTAVLESTLSALKKFRTRLSDLAARTEPTFQGPSP